MRKVEEVIGKKFGRLVAVSVHHKVQQYKSNGTKGGFKYHIQCECECGNKIILVMGDLLNGHSKSCGCLKKDKCSLAATTHGLRKTVLYHRYMDIKSRCYNINNKNYNHYGQRGITICDEWLNKDNGFINFYNWSMSNGYDDKLMIDRINNDKGYSPENCRWADYITQANNKRSNKIIEYKGNNMTVAELGRMINIKYKILQSRLFHYKFENVDNIVDKLISDYKEH